MTFDSASPPDISIKDWATRTKYESSSVERIYYSIDCGHRLNSLTSTLMSTGWCWDSWIFSDLNFCRGIISFISSDFMFDVRPKSESGLNRGTRFVIAPWSLWMSKVEIKPELRLTSFFGDPGSAEWIFWTDQTYITPLWSPLMSCCPSKVKQSAVTLCLCWSVFFYLLLTCWSIAWP